MGVKLSNLIESKEISLDDLRGKIIAIDGYNILYQFLTTIRQRDGTLLMDENGNVTSHLSGLFYRTTKFLEHGIKPVYVFDGKPPEFKKVLEERKKRKEEAEQRYKEALKEGDFITANLYARQTAKLTKEMVEEAKELLKYLGIPFVQAPSEGEAQAAFMAKKGDAYASASQDYDSLLFSSPLLIRNLAITGKRKLPRKNIFVEVKPESIELEHVLNSLKITHDQLILLGLLVGTDYNPGGIKGIGPKKALDLVRKYPKLDLLLSKVEWKEDWPDAEELFNFFKNPPVEKNYNIEFNEIDEEKIIEFMVEKHSFSKDRIKKVLDNLRNLKRKGMQSSLSKWF